jgi:succinoglycan biosynthesis transport protein ExoP
MANQTPPPASGPSLNLVDIYTVLFKHKWLILAFSLLGFAAAGFVYVKMAPPYQSEAWLLVKYVADDKGPLPTSAGEIRQTDLRGEGIMAAEIDILTSLDIARSVVEVMGGQKALGKGAKEMNGEEAAMILRRNLEVDAAKKGNVLHVIYQSNDPSLVQPVLSQVINTYLTVHSKIHRSLGQYDEFLSSQAEQDRAQLQTAQEELRTLKEKYGISTLDETRKEFAERRMKLLEERSSAEAELAEANAVLKVLVKSNATASAAKKMEENRAKENIKAEAASEEATPAAKPSKEVMGNYRRVLIALDDFWKQEQDYRKTFTDESFFIKDLRRQIGELESQKKKLEQDHPGLLSEPVIASQSGGDHAAVAKEKSYDVEGADIRVASLKAKLEQIDVQLEKLKKDVADVGTIESKILDLQRQNDIRESTYKAYLSNLQQARLEATLAATKTANISEIQKPSPPVRDTTKFKKKLAMAAGGGIGAGLVLAFLIELVLNQTVRKPSEISTSFRLPLFVSIPEFGNGNGNALTDARKLLTNGKGIGAAETPPSQNGVAPWDEHHRLHPYSEALRDRLVTFFEMKNMTHKPKLIAVTSCARGAGVTSTAAGLAASLSETGEGNVLLVDMNGDEGAAHPFYKGKPACGIEDVLLHDKRGEAKINDRLYLVTGREGETDSRLPRILPKRFTHLLPKLQASDYDYIIFDMPPVTQTSVTPRLTALMDVVLLMVEAGKTNRDVLRQASALIAETKTNLGVILNRRRNYVPQWLHQEF